MQADSHSHEDSEEEDHESADEVIDLKENS